MIQLTISNSQVVGLESLTRRLSVYSYTEDFSSKTFTVPYVIEHLNVENNKVGIPDIYGTLTAANETILNINTTTFQAEEESTNTIPMGQYDYFKQLQKKVSNETIISKQIVDLNSRNYFS